MAATEELRILLRTVADTSGLTKTEQGLKGLETTGRSGASSLLAFGAAAGIAGVATDRFLNLLGDSLQATRDHERVTRATTASYGAQTAQWTRFATQLSATTGLTSDAILEAALSARTLSSNYGLSIEQTQKLISVSADLARIRGIGVQEAFERVQSAIRGEAEASEYLGLTLNATFIKNNALNGSLKNTYETMTDAQKAQVIYNELLRQTATFQGLAASSADSMDGATQRAGTSVHNLQIEIGKLIEPAVITGLRLVADTLDLIRGGGVIGRAIPQATGDAIREFLGQLGKGQSLAGALQTTQAIAAANREMKRLRELNAPETIFGFGPGTGTVPGTPDPAFAGRSFNLSPGQFAPSDARAAARIAYLDQLKEANRELTDAYAEQNRIERESIQLNTQLAQTQLALLPTTERLQDVQTQIQRDQILLRMRGQISPEQRQAARADIRNLTRNVLPGAELAALDAEIAGRPGERALARNRLLGTIAAGGTAAAEQRVQLVVNGNVGVHLTGDVGMLSDDQKTQIGETIVGMFHNARVAAENSASTRLAGA